MLGLKKIRLGDLLIQEGLITAQQLDDAIESQRKSGLKLGQILVEQGVLTEDALLSGLAKQLNIPLFDLRHYSASPTVVQRLSEAYARRFRAIVLEDREHEYWLGWQTRLT
jgi:MSHA biogenesis protein MshE